ncbi:acyl carrier protein [Actinokineospora auranticolor]|uniref:Phosphopantetheine binding protein n=1 Tax=Actinokineospora auranticolor TaxID=155976 RepID=A0A2S6GTB7_9PSEU|nr:acyl carrier protein [Actinokineospora auranticolor]PPK68417.1 phosphopantetheine binding protein [Actinokineospora auranticolor]
MPQTAADPTGEVTRFVLTEFLPDVAADRLDPDEDLVASGVIDSLGLLKLIAWLADRFAVPVDEVDLDPDAFRSVAAIAAFVTATAGRG